MEWAVGDPCAVGLALAGALREDRADRLGAGVYAAELGGGENAGSCEGARHGLRAAPASVESPTARRARELLSRA